MSVSPFSACLQIAAVGVNKYNFVLVISFYCWTKKILLSDITYMKSSQISKYLLQTFGLRRLWLNITNAHQWRRRKKFQEKIVSICATKTAFQKATAMLSTYPYQQSSFPYDTNEYIEYVVKIPSYYKKGKYLTKTRQS